MLELLPHFWRRKSVLVCIAVSVACLSACGDNGSSAQELNTSQTDAGPAKAKILASDVAATWARAVSNHKTADGATVDQILAYAQAKRPAKFKYRALVGDDDIAYGGATGEPESVSITYWIGSRREDGENYVDIAYDMTPGGHVIEPTANSTPALLALEGGKQSFLNWLDRAYEEDCRDLQTGKLTC